MSRLLPRLPRDTLLVSDAPAALAEAARRGYPVADVTGRNADWLREHWTALTLRHPAALLITHGDRPDLAAVIGDGCNRVGVNNNTGATRARAWVSGILSSVSLLTHCAPAQALAGRLRGFPAFVVGSGPSLAKALQEAATAQQRGVVLSVNSASRLVRGQCVLTVEANDMRGKIEARDSIRLFALGCHDAMWHHGTGPRLPFWTGEVSRPVDALAGVPRVPCSVSGSTAAVSLAYSWGCSPIVLLGQDLSFPYGRVYADSDDTVGDDGKFSWSERARAQSRCDELPVGAELIRAPGIGGEGEEVTTCLPFRHIASWLESVAVAIGGDCELINCTPAPALRLAGWTEARLGDVLAGMSTRGPSIAEIVRRAGPPAVTPARLAEWLPACADAMLESWAMPDLLPLMRAHRSRPPHRSPWLEARAVRRLSDKIEAAAARCRADLETLCQTATPRI